ncbi:hypothetical protein CC80DRAFT_551184 [Byssothecium circinans]|uniref:NAD(P)-binding protein n=1 Tax=Byssothecium circinans TaxID=147558 RepID=A0A6A5TS16_9PLEO|nr:hypothetical protein CC80DRAFT_551184 [Byssothecium circinans]
MEPPYPCPTATWHNDTYSAIDPSKPELSQKGKTVVITGAGSGIGRETAIAFAKAADLGTINSINPWRLN